MITQFSNKTSNSGQNSNVFGSNISVYTCHFERSRDIFILSVLYLCRDRAVLWYFPPGHNTKVYILNDFMSWSGIFWLLFYRTLHPELRMQILHFVQDDRDVVQDDREEGSVNLYSFPMVFTKYGTNVWYFVTIHHNICPEQYVYQQSAVIYSDCGAVRVIPYFCGPIERRFLGARSQEYRSTKPSELSALAELRGLDRFISLPARTTIWHDIRYGRLR